MLITLTWLRVDGLRRWRSLAVLALLIALATATVLTSIAGARRGQTAFDRLWARTLPATVTVLPNQPGFDWAKVAALPEVAALTRFPVVFGFEAQGYPAASTGFPLADDQMTRTIERPVMVAGRLFNPRRADEVIVTPKFAASSGKHVGDMLTLELASVQQANQGYDGTTGPPLGPRIRARIVGVGRTPWGIDADTPGSPGGIITTPALYARYRANMIGTNGQAYINALVRLKGGQAAIPAFRADLARVTGRFTYDPVGGKRPTVVLTAGRMPASPDEIVLAPTTAQEMHAKTGSVVRLTGGTPISKAVRVTGIGFVPPGPHNDYADGAWLTPAGYDRIFGGAHYGFKFHAATVSLRAGVNVQAAARRLDAVAAAIPGGKAFTFTPPDPIPEVQVIQDLELLPVALSAFLALLAISAVGYALSMAVRRRRHDLAVLRALGITRRQARLVITTQASLLALIGLIVGVPVGIAVGRAIWRTVAGFTPLAYHPPVALLALLLIAPATLLAANALAAWPQRRAARLQAGQILRNE